MTSAKRRWRGDAIADVAAGLTEVLAGTRTSVHYACPFDGRYHWYQVLISPIYRGELRKAMTMHVDAPCNAIR